MTKRHFSFIAAMLAAMADNPHYLGRRSTRIMSEKQREQYEREKREKARRLYPMDLSEREFTIHGEKIMAHDRKTALKIYANRHSKKKRR